MYYWCCHTTFCWHVFKYQSVSCPFMLFYCPCCSLKISLNPLHDNEGSQSSHVIVVLKATCLCMSSCPRARIHHSSQGPSAWGLLCKDKLDPWVLGHGTDDLVGATAIASPRPKARVRHVKNQEEDRELMFIYMWGIALHNITDKGLSLLNTKRNQDCQLLSKWSGFFPRSENTHVRPIGNSKLNVGVSASVNGRFS